MIKINKKLYFALYLALFAIPVCNSLSKKIVFSEDDAPCSSALRMIQNYESDEECVETDGDSSTTSSSSDVLLTDPRPSVAEKSCMESPGLKLRQSPHKVKITPLKRSLTVKSRKPEKESRAITLGFEEKEVLKFDVEVCSDEIKALIEELTIDSDTVEREQLHSLELDFWSKRLIRCGYRVIKYFPYRTEYMTKCARKSAAGLLSVNIPDMSDFVREMHTVDHAVSYELIVKALAHKSTQVYEKNHEISVSANDGSKATVIKTTVLEVVYPVEIEYKEQDGTVSIRTKYCVISFGKLIADLQAPTARANAKRFWHVFHACLQDNAHAAGRTPVRVAVEIVNRDGQDRLELVKI